MITYTAEVLEKIEREPGLWPYLRVGVFRQEGESKTQVGEYVRNYHALLRTFYPFQQNGKDYALYSPYYTATRIMALPSCRDIGGEEPLAGGFCPADFYVPCYVDREWINWNDTLLYYRVNEPELREAADPKIKDSPLAYYPFGFVAGCHWGDDSSWKIRYLDLSEAAEGRIKSDARFGYIAMADTLTLKQAVDMTDYAYDPDEEESHHITFSIQSRYDLRTGKSVKIG